MDGAILLQQIVGVLDALRNALTRDHWANTVSGNEGFKLHVRDFGVNGHVRRVRRSTRAAG